MVLISEPLQSISIVRSDTIKHYKKKIIKNLVLKYFCIMHSSLYAYIFGNFIIKGLFVIPYP
jgi:hypothetical protein